MQKTEINISVLDAPTILHVLSYLELQSTVCLLKACNKILYSKIRGFGGLRSLSVFDGVPTNFWTSSGLGAYREELEPILSDPSVPQKYDLRTMHHPLLSCLTSFTFWNAKTTSYVPMVDELPKTLTHLNWQAPPLPFYVKDGGPPISQCLPQLLHLSFRGVETVPETHDLLAQLPKGLLSLTLPLLKNNFAPMVALPPYLTQLSVVQTKNRRVYYPPTLLTSDHLAVSLPSTVTDLRLYGYSFELSKSVTSWPWRGLFRLHLTYCSPEALELLPPEIQHLELMNGFVEPGTPPPNHLKWPERVQHFSVAFDHCWSSSALSPPHLTSLSLLNTTSLYDNTFILDLNNMIPPTLTKLDLPELVIREALLPQFPSHLHLLRLWDIKLDGSSFIPNITALDSLVAVQDMFWHFPYTFTIFLIRAHPLQQFSPDLNLPASLKSLRFPGHRKSITGLPQGIQIAEHICGIYQPIQSLPDSLTHLSFDEVNNRPVLLKPSLLNKLRYLRYACIQLDSSFMPSIDSNWDENACITLPDDAIAIFYGLFPQIRFENMSFDGTNLLLGISTFPAVHEVILKGTYVLSAEFATSGFIAPLKRAHLGKAAFRKQNQFEYFIPTLPDSLTDLTLGAKEGALFLNPIHSPEHTTNWIPKHLRHLTIDKTDGGYTSRPWTFPPLPHLTKLTVMASYIDPTQIASLPSHLNIRRLNSSETILVAEAAEMPASPGCSIV